MKKSLVLYSSGAALILAATTALLCHGHAEGGAAAAVTGTKPLAIPASTTAHIAAEGRVVAYPGAEVVVGTDFAGTLRRLPVQEKDAVGKGDVLAEFVADVERAALREAEARVAEAGADVKLFQLERSRAEQLLASKAGAKQAVDKAARDLDGALSRRATAAAEIERLHATIAKSRLCAPISGVVVARHAEAGETLDRGARVVTLVDLKRLRIEAEVDESDASRVVLGAPVAIRGEGEAGPALGGRVAEIPDAVTARRTKPQDPGKPSDTRVLLVKIAFDDPSLGAALKLGRRVEVEIDGQSR